MNTANYNFIVRIHSPNASNPVSAGTPGAPQGFQVHLRFIYPDQSLNVNNITFTIDDTIQLNVTGSSWIGDNELLFELIPPSNLLPGSHSLQVDVDSSIPSWDKSIDSVIVNE